ncbi:PulJ/GspJ family protein [Neptunicella marina]|uniref:Prepilin-type N-terminal cleavage/methylation domain-containing protein n=1 Tax=Neptunicella marina TaxID=2125989 RepID=A0A8J6ISS3_9ALTE|nr:prepilin-type N-terminal cleavage/methylation domain-containing protein [Neptunicella marina]MBC3764936.1 prepilin-type N-terminal cleavage/methylation domain-containing protein [Neptunicella marina]
MTKMPKAFTLIEMLVVLVILSLTTVLMTQGLSNTWRNFDRLGARDLMFSSVQLPKVWFNTSVQGAVLYHPETSLFSGNQAKFSFVSANVPSEHLHLPQAMTWQIMANSRQWELQFKSYNDAEYITVAYFKQQPYFFYFVDGAWLSEFSPSGGLLPKAIRIVAGDQIWLQANVGRPVDADIPVELPLFGEYEF